MSKSCEWRKAELSRPVLMLASQALRVTSSELFNCPSIAYFWKKRVCFKHKCNSQCPSLAAGCVSEWWRGPAVVVDPHPARSGVGAHLCTLQMEALGWARLLAALPPLSVEVLPVGLMLVLDAFVWNEASSWEEQARELLSLHLLSPFFGGSSPALWHTGKFLLDVVSLAYILFLFVLFCLVFLFSS